MDHTLSVIQSNRTELLASRLAEELQDAPLASPLVGELIVVQDRAVGTWLDLQLARFSGIAANIRYAAPGEFIWDLYRKNLSSIPERSPFDTEILQWRIFDALADPAFTGAHAAIGGFLKKGDAARRFDLAGRLADLYNRYLVYRMDWLKEWESGRTANRGPDEQWQAPLWRRLVRGTDSLHRGRLYDSLLAKLGSGRAPNLPERVSVFGISSLSPAYIGILRALAGHARVQVYVLNPCREKWDEITDEKSFAQLDVEYSPDLMHLDVPHALLASLGKQGRDFNRFIVEAEGEGRGTQNMFQDPGSDTLLRALQSGILNLSEQPVPYREGDGSVQVHSCHTPMREVEVLRDRLLGMLEKDRTLSLSDIMVVAPDINTYAPYIEAVFPAAPRPGEGDDAGSPSIPYEIADRTPAQVDPVVEAWLGLFDLLDSRFDADSVVELLRLDPLRTSFGISPEEIDRIAAWVAGSGIRWGRDAAHKVELGLPAEPTFTWSWGLERMILGVALPRSAAGDALPLFDGILPYDTIEGQEIDLLDRFVRFLSALREWVEELRNARPMREWGPLLTRWLERVLPSTRETLEGCERIRGVVKQAVADSAAASYDRPVDPAVIRAIMLAGLGEDLMGARFMTGGITFCSMKPMRALPFRVVCMLGMSDGEFPRDRRPPSFDLMRKLYRHGDRSGRLDDRYLFLELILSARDTLLVSYVGEDVQSGKKLPLSAVVSELLDFLGRIAFPGAAAGKGSPSPRDLADAALVVRHPLQAFSTRYFSGEDPKLFSYSGDACRMSQEIGRGTTEHHDLFPATLPPVADDAGKVRIADLCRFYRNPAKHLFERRLGVFYRMEDDILQVDEPQVVGKAEQRAIDRAVADAVRVGRPVDHQLRQMLSAEGKLPVGPAGTEGFEKVLKDSEKFQEACRLLLAEPRIPPLAASAAIGEREIEIEEANVTSHGFFEVKPGKIYESDWISFFVRFAAVCLVHPGRGKGGLIGTLVGFNAACTFPEVDDPAKTLGLLLQWYGIGLSRPLHFFPASSWAYVEALAKFNDPDLALEQVRKKQWDPENEHAPYPDCKDEYYRRVFSTAEKALDEEFRALAGQIAGAAIAGFKVTDFTRTEKQPAREKPAAKKPRK